MFIKGALSKWICIGLGSGEYLGFIAAKPMVFTIKISTNPKNIHHIQWQVYRAPLINMGVRVPLTF